MLQRLSKPLLLLMTAITLCLYFPLLSAAPLLALRKAFGRESYYFAGLGVGLLFWGFGWPSVGGVFVAITALAGAYVEFSGMGLTRSQSSLYSVVVAVLVAAAGFCFWAVQLGAGWMGQLETHFAQLMSQMAAMGVESTAQLALLDVLKLAPAGTMVLLMFGLMLGLIFEKYFLFWMQMPFKIEEPLRNFRVPDFLVWVFIASLLGAFLEWDSTWLKIFGSNLLVVSVTAYFFQGLAVAAHFLDTFKFGMVWRILFMFVLVFQLSFVLAGVGLADFWIDFRSWFMKKSARMKKSI